MFRHAEIGTIVPAPAQLTTQEAAHALATQLSAEAHQAVKVQPPKKGAGERVQQR